MKKSLTLLATIAALASSLPVATNAAAQVYNLNADWSDTANPNGTWSYREGESLLIDTPFPWVGANYGTATAAVFTKSAAGPEYQGGIDAGYLEPGDIFVDPGIGGNVLWTTPASGTISISGVIWPAPIYGLGGGTFWALELEGSPLSDGELPGLILPVLSLDGDGSSYDRSSPYDLSLGSGGTAALLNIPVAAGDQVVLELSGTEIGLNFTITFTPDSADPVSAIEDLALRVAAMNLQNGIENSLDSKLDAALNALDDVNANNDGAACNTLQAFINAVEAQRGNKLTDAQAGQLIAAAQAIQALLDCGD